MNDPFARFLDNIDRVYELGGLADAINSVSNSVLDVSDIYRSQVVLCVSALDCYIHSAVRRGIVDIYTGVRPCTNAYNSFPVDMSSLHRSHSDSDPVAWLNDYVIEKHGYLSFQHPDKISPVLKCISDKPIWVEVARLMSVDSATVKLRLKLVVSRRNQIAHESDLDPSDPSVRWSITKSDVEDVVDFVLNLVTAINLVIR